MASQDTQLTYLMFGTIRKSTLISYALWQHFPSICLVRLLTQVVMFYEVLQSRHRFQIESNNFAALAVT
jgi:hypothetical protein